MGIVIVKLFSCEQMNEWERERVGVWLLFVFCGGKFWSGSQI